MPSYFPYNCEPPSIPESLLECRHLKDRGFLCGFCCFTVLFTVPKSMARIVDNSINVY